MKKWLHIHVIILTLGFFFLPASTYACGTKSEKSCCKKEVTSNTDKQDCCKKKQSQDKENQSCGGKCGHSNCTTSSVNFSLISFFEIEFKNTHFQFSPEKQKFYHSETFISSGFNFIWLPPKIS